MVGSGRSLKNTPLNSINHGWYVTDQLVSQSIVGGLLQINQSVNQSIVGGLL